MKVTSHLKAHWDLVPLVYLVKAAGWQSLYFVLEMVYLYLLMFCIVKKPEDKVIIHKVRIKGV